MKPHCPPSPAVLLCNVFALCPVCSRQMFSSDHRGEPDKQSADRERHWKGDGFDKLGKWLWVINLLCFPIKVPNSEDFRAFEMNTSISTKLKRYNSTDVTELLSFKS